MVATVQTAARLLTASQVTYKPWYNRGRHRGRRSELAGSNEDEGYLFNVLCESNCWFPGYRKHYQNVAAMEVAR